MGHKVKTVPLAGVKAGPADGLKDREFLVYPSTFIRSPDAYGDVVAPGTFAETISEWKDSGKRLPGLFGHRMDDPDFYVASALDMGEDDHGWWVKGVFDESAKAQRVYELVKDGRLSQLSFAYDVLDEGKVELDDGTVANELRKVNVYEFSFVPIGANQDTSVEAVKSLADDADDADDIANAEIVELPYDPTELEPDSRLKAGRVLSAKNEKTLNTALAAIGDAVKSIKSVLSQLGGDDQEDPKDEAAKGGKASRRLELLETTIGLCESEEGEPRS